MLNILIGCRRIQSIVRTIPIQSGRQGITYCRRNVRLRFTDQRYGHFRSHQETQLTTVRNWHFPPFPLNGSMVRRVLRCFPLLLPFSHFLSKQTKSLLIYVFAFHFAPNAERVILSRMIEKKTTTKNVKKTHSRLAELLALSSHGTLLSMKFTY